jgi:Cu-Zn family superoxide dismutase
MTTNTKINIVALAALMLLASLSAVAEEKEDAIDNFRSKVVNNENDMIGNIDISDGGVGVVVTVSINEGLAPGWHGLHFHSVADCSDTENFSHSKGHITAAKKQHGLLNPRGPEEGDLTNIYANSDGSAYGEFYSHNIRLEDGTSPLKDKDGSAFIIHAGKDDHHTQTTGNSGDRIACAEIK